MSKKNFFFRKILTKFNKYNLSNKKKKKIINNSIYKILLNDLHIYSASAAPKCKEDQRDLAEAIKCFPDRSPPNARNSYFLPGVVKTITKHHKYYVGRNKYRETLRAESSALANVYLVVETHETK